MTYETIDPAPLSPNLCPYLWRLPLARARSDLRATLVALQRHRLMQRVLQAPAHMGTRPFSPPLKRASGRWGERQGFRSDPTGDPQWDERGQQSERMEPTLDPAPKRRPLSGNGHGDDASFGGLKSGRSRRGGSIRSRQMRSAGRLAETLIRKAIQRAKQGRDGAAHTLPGCHLLALNRRGANPPARMPADPPAEPLTAIVFIETTM
jgi:hypothetical protein